MSTPRERAAFSPSFPREKKLTLKQAAGLPVWEERPLYETIRGWCTRGCYGYRLQHRRQGKTILTSAEACERFMEAMNA